MRVELLCLPMMVLLLVSSGCSAEGAPPRRRAAASESYETGLRPRAVAVGDFNGDRSLDVAIANSGNGTVTTLLARSRGFRPGGTFAAGNEPCDIKTGDVDRDGDLDLFIANHGTSWFTVLINDGKARFASAAGSPFATGARPHIHSVIASDFDGDGWIDVAVESADTQEVRLRRGRKGGFGPVIPIAVRTMPYFQLGAADVTGDKIADVLIPGHGDGTVRAVTKSGSGFVLAPFTIATRGKPWVVTAGNLNGDTRPDLVVLESDAVSVWLKGPDAYRPAQGSPVRVPGATGVAVGKLDGDDVDDIVLGPWEGNDITIVDSRASKPRTIHACGQPIGLAIADLDQDGEGDIVVTCATEGRVVVLRSPLQ